MFPSQSGLNEFAGWLRISNDAFTDIKRYPSVVNDTAIGDSVHLMSADELNELPPNLSRIGNYRKNTVFTAGVQPTIDSFYFWVNGDSIWYSEKPESTFILG